MKHVQQGVDGICSINVGWALWMHMGKFGVAFSCTRGMAGWILI